MLPAEIQLGDAPRDASFAAALVRSAGRLHIIPFWIATALAVGLGALFVAGADDLRDGAERLPAAGFLWLVLGAPFLAVWRRGRRRLLTIARDGELLSARITGSTVFATGFGSHVNRITLVARDAAGAELTAVFALGGSTKHHDVGETLPLLYHPTHRRLAIIHSPKAGTWTARVRPS